MFPNLAAKRIISGHDQKISPIFDMLQYIYSTREGRKSILKSLLLLYVRLRNICAIYGSNQSPFRSSLSTFVFRRRGMDSIDP